MNRLSEEQKVLALKVAGAVILAFTFFAFVSSLSYLFTWKADMSLLTDPDMMDPGTAVANGGGKLGFRFGRFLVCRCFGLGSFAFLFLLGAAGLKLLTSRWRFSILKMSIVCILAGILSSLLFSAIAGTIGSDTVFGGGLGGRCGTMIFSWSSNLFGIPVTFVFIALLAFIFLIFCNSRFAGFVAGKGASAEENGHQDPGMEESVTVREDSEIEEMPAPMVMPEEQEAPEEQSESPAENPSDDAAPAPDPDSPMDTTRDETLTAEDVKELPRINVRDELPRYKMPSIDLLEAHSFGKQEVSNIELVRNRNQIQAALANYKIKVLDVKAVVGPTVTLYKVYPAPGVKIADIKRLQEDIALSLNAKGVRVVTLSDSVGIEVANDKPSIVPIKALMNDEAFRNSKAELPVAVGYTITQKVKVFDLADAPHLLIAGATKQGKSVGLNVIVASLLYRKHPSEMKFVFIDPKMVEFSAYAKLLKHYLAVLPEACSEEDEMQNAIVKKAKDAEKILRSLCIEMDARYELLSKALVNNVVLYNDKYRDRHLNPQKGHRFLPYLVVVIDEYADLTMSAGGSAESKAAARSIQNSIIRLAQKGRAAGIHVILATQRPSVDVISGTIKTNFPTRIAFRVASRVDSITILDAPGAEKLIGKGDMLYYAGVETERVQCGYISNDEINGITDFVGAQTGFQKCYNTPFYLPEPAPAEGEAGGGMVDMSALDERFEEAARLIVTMQRGSTSDLQRRLGMGYAKAGRVMDQLEAAGIVGPQQGSKPREVLIQQMDELDNILKAYTHK